jgi:hypothetical protein
MPPTPYRTAALSKPEAPTHPTHGLDRAQTAALALVVIWASVRVARAMLVGLDPEGVFALAVMTGGLWWLTRRVMTLRS